MYIVEETTLKLPIDQYYIQKSSTTTEELRVHECVWDVGWCVLVVSNQLTLVYSQFFKKHR